MSLTDGADQGIIAPTVISGVVSNVPNNEFRVVIDNTSANKLDYYLQKTTKIESASCKTARNTKITATVTNTLTSTRGLSDYVMGRADLKLPHGANGRNGFTVLIYGPTGATSQYIDRSDPKGDVADLETERGRPIVYFRVDLAMGASETFTVIFVGGTGPVTYVKQPLVLPEKVTIRDSCA